MQRGTLQHEVLEGERATVFQDGDSIVLKVNCRAEADDIPEPIRYGLVLTLEIAEEVQTSTLRHTNLSRSARPACSSRPSIGSLHMTCREISYAAYKPSDAEWLDDIPEQWEVRRLRTTAKMMVSSVDKHTRKDEFPVRLCNYVDVYNNDRITQELSFMRANGLKR